MRVHIINTQLAILLTATAALILQGARALSVSGVVPNLVLIVFFVAIFWAPTRKKLILVIPSLMVFFLLSVIWFKFWIFPFLIIVALVVIAHIIQPYLTGSQLVDFVAVLAGGTVLFRLMLVLFGSASWSWFIVFGEVLYNILLGMVVLVLAQRISIQ